MLRAAAAVQALEAVGLCVAAVAQGAEAAGGHSYRTSDGVALAVMELIVVALLAGIASGIAQLRPWTRTPAIMTQLGCGLLAIILLQAGRLDWGLPTLVLAIAGLAGLLHPASLTALARPPQDPPPAAPAAPVSRAATTARKKKSTAR
jgi:hypothetical protein